METTLDPRELKKTSYSFDDSRRTISYCEVEDEDEAEMGGEPLLEVPGGAEEGA